MKESRARYLLYRCYLCKRLLTRLEIVAAWEKAEAGIPQSGICPCGSGKVSPTNATIWEEIFLPRVWRLWWKEIVIPKLKLHE